MKKSKDFTIPILAGVLIAGILIVTNVCALNPYCKTDKLPVDGPKTNITDIDAVEARQLVFDNRNSDNFRIIDIRTPSEYSEGHLEFSRNIDYYNDDFKNKLNLLDKEKTYLVYCRSGSRSGQSMKTFEELGFTKIYNLETGYIDWAAKGYDTVK